MSTGVIVGRRPEAKSVRFAFGLPEELVPFIAPQGLAGLDGVSLAVNEVSGDRFSVNVIPHTLACTNFDVAAPGQLTNLQVGLIARYVVRLLGSAPSITPN